jgi:flagellar biosynthetic protein FliR
VTLTLNGQELIGFLLASVRIIAWMAVVPPFSSRSVPPMAKVAISLGLAIAVGPAMGKDLPIDSWSLIVVTLTQVVVGAGMGFVTFVLFQAIATAGSLIDMFGGFANAQGFDPLGMNMNTVFGKFHQQLAIVLLFVTGGHLIVIGGLLSTFELLPLGATPEIEGAPGVLMTAFSLFFVTAVQIALPMIAVLFVADLALALLTKVAPNLNAINVVFPAKIGLTLVLLGMSFPVLPDVLDRLVDLANEAVASLAGAG